MRANERDSGQGSIRGYRAPRGTRLVGGLVIALLALGSFAPAAAASAPIVATARVVGLDAHLQQGDIIFASLILVATLVTAWNVRRYLRMGEGANRRTGE